MIDAGPVIDLGKQHPVVRARRAVAIEIEITMRLVVEDAIGPVDAGCRCGAGDGGEGDAGELSGLHAGKNGIVEFKTVGGMIEIGDGVDIGRFEDGAEQECSARRHHFHRRSHHCQNCR
jgi:hypothetical protein